MSGIKLKLMKQVTRLRNFVGNMFHNGILNEILRNPIMHIKNQKKSEIANKITGKLQVERNEITSITDSHFFSDYSGFCQVASENSLIFKYFRAHPTYRDVLEHVSHPFGVTYAKRLRESNRIEALKSTALRIDNFGSPWQFYYKGFGKVSPTTLRYLYFLDCILDLFPDVQFKTICEVGGGFGGQSLALSYHYKLEEVSFVDIQSALSLTSKFLDSNQAGFHFFCRTPDKENSKKFDLFLSNYAFSELTRQFQDFYLKNYISNSAFGFIMWNPLSFNQLDGYSLEELLDAIPGAKAMAEDPETYPGNSLIFWARDLNNLYS